MATAEQVLSGRQIINETQPFFDWLASWYDQLPKARFEEIIPDTAHAAILTVDLIEGFCSQGPLASERVSEIVPQNVTLFEKAHARGVTRFVLAQDAHTSDTPEFDAWPPHCVRGTSEAATVEALARLPFMGELTLIEKNSINAGINTCLQSWLVDNDDVTHYVITGDCTDLCTYQLAMFVRLWANATNRSGKQVIVDAAAVQTYDLPVNAANGAFPHPGDFLHMVFLYHMALNGIRVLAEII
jgi:nicotinamidase-related amidase